MSIELRVAAKYRSKKELESGNTLYLYSERQVADRNRKKAERVEKLRKSVEKLRKKVKKDLSSDDLMTKYTALAVALIDHTYERVGNDDSAGEGHFGVTGWQKQHVKFSGGTATIKYVGKSGVKQEKKVTDKDLLKALKDAHGAAKGKESCIFELEDGSCVKAKEVNAYLKDFDVTAKDLRGFHANREMQECLRAIRGKGKKLPEDKKEREKLLKAEFKEALEQVAAAVGHEASTLKSQYLVPGLESHYLADGSVIEKLDEKKKKADLCAKDPPLVFADRMIRMFVDHMLGSEVVMDKQDFMTIRMTFGWCGGQWQKILEGDPVHHELLKTVMMAWSQLGIKRDVESG
jgi:hypothetical protein